MRNICLLMTMLLSALYGFSQDVTVRGRVTKSNNQPADGINVLLKTTKKGTTTDGSGNYVISAPSKGTLVFSGVGFATKEVAINGQTTLNVELSEVAGQLEEVVVTALGIKKERKALGYALTEVKGEELTQARTNNFVNNLAGKVAGLSVTTTAGGPGAATRVILRGNTAISGDNQPLYVVDGIPIDNSARGSAGEWGGRDGGDGIQMLNPDEIETVSILKGGNAAALYGFRASNGVILVTTKKGSKRKGLGIEVNSNLAVENVINFTNWQDQYGHGVSGNKPVTQSDANGINLNSWGAKLDGTNVMQWDGVARPYVAVKDNLKNFYNTGTNVNNSVTLYGGSDKMTYNFSMSDQNNQSIIPNSTLRRNNFAVNVGMTPIDKLTVNLSARYIRERVKNRPRLSDSPGNANFTVGLMPTNWMVQTFKDAKTDANGNENKFNGNPYVTNPYWAVENFIQKDSRDRLIAAIESRYDFTKWLYTRARLGVDRYSATNFEVTPNGTQFSPGGQINDQSTNIFRETNAELLVGTQTGLAKDLNLDAFVGGNLMTQINEGQSFSGNNFVIPGFYNINNLQDKNINSGYREKRVNSVFASAELAYKKYLYLTFTGRSDWYSTLPKENWSIVYPSVSTSFILSDVVTLPKVINYAKIRASWARIGADRDPYGLSLPYGLNSNGFGGVTLGGIATGTIPNKQLLPYVVTATELGLEARLFKNRMAVDFTFYDRKTTDDIIASQISTTSGYNSVLINVGEVRNKGIELMVSGTPYKSGKFTWDVSYNIGYNKGTVNKISDQLTTSRVANARSLTAFVDHIVGKPFGQVMATDYKRDAAGQILLKDGLAQRGNLIAMGTGVSPYTMGLNNDFRVGAFSVGFLIDARFGGVMYSGTNDFGTYRGLTQMTLDGRNGGLIAAGVDDVTKRTNAVKVDAQSYYQSVALNISTPFVYKSDFIKLRQVIIGYNVPANKIAKTPFKGINLSLVARNLAVLLKHTPNVDPESTYNAGNGQGLEWYGMPPVRSLGLNVNVKF